MKRKAAAILAALLCATLSSGCATPRAATTRPAIYTGPTDPLDVVLARINANNNQIRTLVANGTFGATLGKDQRYLNGQVTLLHTKPNKLLLKLNKDIASEVLTAGSNGQRWWVSAFGDVDTTWYGTPQRAANADPRLPISPELIADVLGVATLDLDMLAQPVPTMRFNPNYDCYMLEWHVPITDRWVTLREVWYDRQTLEPRRIWLFDRNGRVAVAAQLSDFSPMEDAADTTAAPKMARTFDLFFPETQSHVTFRFDDVRSTRNKRPNEQTYQFDPTRVRTTKVENLDEADAPK